MPRTVTVKIDGMTSPKPAVLITGAAKRIGAAIAKQLSASGWAVAIHYNRSQRDATLLRDALVASGGEACVVQGDLRSVEETAALFASAREQLGELTALVNNASLFDYDRGSATDWSQYQAHMDTNLRAPIQLAQLLHAQGEVIVPRCVVNILDQKVFNLNADFFSYTLSKVGLEAATRMLALELAPSTRVCAVAPGITMQSTHQSADNFARGHTVTPLGHSSDPTDIADAVAYLLKARAVTGATMIVDGGQHLFPMTRDVMFEVETDE